MRVLLAIATIWPVLYMVIFLGFILFVILSPAEPQQDIFVSLFVVHFMTFLLVIGLAIFYICHVFKNRKLSGEQKTLWTVVFIFAGAIAMPIYWYQYICKNISEPGNGGTIDSTD